jgi:membrane protease YdiL (CAAX protease family)
VEPAPATGGEIAAWTLLCLLAGFVEEVVFRGYLQRQFIHWARGGAGPGVLASAVLFGAIFRLLALYRRSLRTGIFAYAWHDLIAGLTLALHRSAHVI